MKLEELGWKFVKEKSKPNYFVYQKGISEIEYIFVDIDKKKICTSAIELSFATLEAIRKLIIDNAIY